MAEWTGLEPATPGVTGRYSNQLNYHSAENRQTIGCLADQAKTRETIGCLAEQANTRETIRCLAEQANTRETIGCLADQANTRNRELVGADGIEPPTFAL
jgi:hypothetical protein